MLDMIRESGEVPEKMKRRFNKGVEFYQVFGFNDNDAVDSYIKSNGGRRFESLSSMVKDPLYVDTTALVTCDRNRVFVALHRVLLVPGNDDVYVVGDDIFVAIDKERSIPIIPVKDFKRIVKDIGRKSPSSEISRVRNYSI